MYGWFGLEDKNFVFLEGFYGGGVCLCHGASSRLAVRTFNTSLVEIAGSKIMQPDRVFVACYSALWEFEGCTGDNPPFATNKRWEALSPPANVISRI